MADKKLYSEEEIEEIFRKRREAADEYARTHDGWRAADHCGSHIFDLYLSDKDNSDDAEDENQKESDVSLREESVNYFYQMRIEIESQRRRFRLEWI